MKQILKWVIPVGALLLIGMWIGLNWEHFPANEEVSIPVVKTEEVKYDTAVNASVKPDELDQSTDPDESNLQATEDSIQTAIESMEANGSDIDETKVDESITEEVTDAEPQPQETIASPTRKVVRKSTNSSAGVYTKQSMPVAKRIITPEQTNRNSNRNVTPSPRTEIRSENTPTSNKEVVQSSTAKKKPAEPLSYMSRKQIPVDYLVEVDGTYQPSASGKGVSAAKFIVYNRSGKNLKKVNMEVQYLGKGNQLLRKVEMPVSNISADGAVSVEVPANTEADRLVYKVLYVSSSLGDFYYEPIHIYASALK